MRRHTVLNALILLPILGCGEAQESAVKSAKQSWVSAPGDAAKSETPASPNASGRAYASSAMMGGMAGAMGTALHAPVNTAALSRKIVYDGEIDLIVSAYARTETDRRTVGKANGRRIIGAFRKALFGTIFRFV